MSGSGGLVPAAVCDTDGLQSKRVDRITTAEGAIALDDMLMTRSPNQHIDARPGADTLHLASLHYWKSTMYLANFHA
jgi:hypothetical protein